MLAEVPTNTDSSAIWMWENCRNLTVEIFEKYWAMIDKETDMIDTQIAEFASWSDKFKSRCSGMKHKTMLKSHGVVRKIGEKFGILECTTKNGRAHGLKVEFSANTIAVELWKDGKLLAFFIFDNNFKELERKGKNVNLLDGLSPKDFRLIN